MRPVGHQGYFQKARKFTISEQIREEKTHENSYGK